MGLLFFYLRFHLLSKTSSTENIHGIQGWKGHVQEIVTVDVFTVFLKGFLIEHIKMYYLYEKSDLLSLENLIQDPFLNPLEELLILESWKFLISFETLEFIK